MQEVKLGHLMSETVFKYGVHFYCTTTTNILMVAQRETLHVGDVAHMQ